MVITVTNSFTFQLLQYIPVTNTICGVINTVVLAQCTAVPGSQQTVPDWVAITELFQTAVAAGTATVITEPTGVVALNAGLDSANVELPQTGQTVFVTNNDVDTYVWILLGNSTVTVSVGHGPNIPNGAFIVPGGTVMLPLDGNTYLAAIGLKATNALGVAVV